MADKTTKNNTDGEQPMNIPIRAADGQYLSALHPKYLHTNSTSHTWPFSAVAELIGSWKGAFCGKSPISTGRNDQLKLDNAYDPDVNASQLFIDVRLSNGQYSLVFTDNGSGMFPDQLYKMVSFGFSEKKAVKDHLPVGQYGNGFKSGSMRLGKDCLVFTKTESRWSLGFLSQTYLEKIGSNTIIVPFVTWEPKRFSLQGAESGGAKSLREILAHSVVTTIPEIKNEFKQISGTTGTRIIISNLRKTAGGVKYELDFTADSNDIRIPDDLLDTDESRYKREQRQDHIPASDYSLRAYCAILYLKPRMQIILRGKKVRTTVIAKSLAKTEVDYYKPVTPSGYAKQVKITFGFSQNKNHYGIMMYHKNRLIKPYVRVGHQLKPNSLGVGVIGVIECDFLQPTHNKQDFDQSKAFRACMQGLGRKLNEYWQEKKGSVKSKSQNSQQQGATDDSEVMLPDQKWAQCDNPKCLKWRLLPDATDLDSLPDKWYCKDHPLEQWRSCDIPEQLEEEKDTTTAQPYAKEVTKQLRKERELKRKQNESSIKKASELQQIVEKKDKELEEEKRKRTQNEEKAKSHEEEIKRLKMELEKSNSKSNNQTPAKTPSTPSNSSTSGPSLRSSSRIAGASSTRSAASSASKTPVASSTPSAPRPAAASASSTPKASQPTTASPATRTPTRAASANRPIAVSNGSPATGSSVASSSPSIAASPARPTRQSINQAIKVRLPFTSRRTSQPGVIPQTDKAGTPVTPKVEQGAKPAVVGTTSPSSQKALPALITQAKANVNTATNSLLIKQGNKFPVVATGSQQKPGTRVYHLVVTDPSKISANIAAITGNASNISIRPGLPITVSSAGDGKPRPIPIVQAPAPRAAAPQLKGVNPQLKNTPTSRDIDQQLAQIGIDAIAAQSHQMLPSMAMSTLNPSASATISRPPGTTTAPTNRQATTTVASTSAAPVQKLPNGKITSSSSTNRQDPSKHAGNKRAISEDSDDDNDDDDLQIVEPTPTKKVKLEQTSENSSKRPLRNAVNNQGEQPKVNGVNKAEDKSSVNTNNVKQERIEIPPDVLKTTDKDLIEDVNKVPNDALRGVLARRSQQLRDLRKSLCQLLGLLVPDLNLPRTDSMPLDDNAIDVLLRDVLDANKESKAM